MSVLDISYTIIFDNEKKISYKRLGVYYKNNNLIQDISSIFVIKPSKRYNNYLKGTDLSFNNEYDLSFSNVSSIEFSDILKNDMKLLPGKWTFGYRNDYLSSTNDLSGVKSVFIPYRDFLYDNNEPLLTRDQDNYNKLFLNINHLELFNFYNNNKTNFFSLGKDNGVDSSGNTHLKTFLDFILWFPEDEISINLLKTNGWSLPENFLGVIADKRVKETPTYHTDQNGNITLYENLSSFNEPGFRYDNASHIGRQFYINYVARMKKNNSHCNNIYSQYDLIQKDTSFNLVEHKFIKIDGTEDDDIDNWELEIYILDDTILENITDPSGVFSYSKTPEEKTGILFGIRGDGDDQTDMRDLSGSKSYIFRDIDGKSYHANLSLYGVRKVGDKYKGGFTIRYKIRKNEINKYDVYIFINDNFVKKVDNSGCKLDEISYWGLPSDSNLNSNHMIKSISRVFESKLSTNFDGIYQDNSYVNWDNSKNLFPIKLNNNENNNMFSYGRGLEKYPVLFNQDETNIWEVNKEYNYTFDAGSNNTINFCFIDFSFNHVETSSSGNANQLLSSSMSISVSDDNINWLPISVEWMHKTNDYSGNTLGGYLPSFYSDFYYTGSGIGGSGGIKINVSKNWIDDKNGFILPKNETYAGNMSSGWDGKVITDYRYAKIKFKTTVGGDKPEWNIKIFIKEDNGFEKSILPNYNNIDIDTSDNQIESICYELDSATLNKTIFTSSNNYSKNNYEIPYIARYDYKMQDNSNNIILKSQIDKDIIYDINDVNYNYNCKRTMKEIEYLPKTLTSLNDSFYIRQKYNYNSKLLNDTNTSASPYKPGKATINFINTNNTVIITIPESQIVELKNNLINYWNGKDYPTYVNFILYIWYPWTDKYLKYNTNETQAGIDLSNNLNDQGCDEIITLNMNTSTYYTINQVGIPLSNDFNYIIKEFSGRYLFSWSYQVFQPSGIYNNQTPFENLQLINETYIPEINILDIKDFVNDDFIYDPQRPLITYIPGADPSVDFDKIKICLDDNEIVNFNENIKKHRRSLISQNCDISAVEIKFYVWTPNNEKKTNPQGWELPSDYYGVTDERINMTPYRFSNLQYGITNINWDPQYVLNNEMEFGYNINSSGVIVKTFDISSNFYIGDLSGNQKMEFDISYSMIYFHPDDGKKDTINESVPNPYKYKKNSIFGVPYLSRWGFKIFEDLSFKDSLIDSVGDVLIKPITNNDISYNGQYPVIFKDDGNNNNYSNSFEGVQVFDAGEGNTISLLVEEIKFHHTINNDSSITYNDRLALLVSDLSGNDLSFNPIEINWMHKTNLSVGDISGGDIGSSPYYNDVNGFVFPEDKLTAVRNYKSSPTETNQNDFENLNLHLLTTKKRYAKFRFISDNSDDRRGWAIKIMTSKKNPINIIESRVKKQEGNIGNAETDFNLKFKFNSDYYLELDKSIKNIYSGILDFKDFVNTGITLGFQKKKPFLIIKINDILWQFVIKVPPEGYIFDNLDENGNVLGQLSPVSNIIIGPNNIDLKVNNIGNTSIKLDDTMLTFDETVSSNSFDGGRKYTMYIRKSTNKEKIFFEKYKKNILIQFSSIEINNRLADWYPLNIKYELSNNKYNYGTLFDTEEVELENVAIIEEIKKVDHCKLCRTITKTKNSNNSNLRYANKVKINFNLANRLRENCS